MDINKRVDRQESANFKVIFYLFFILFLFYSAQKYKLY